MSTKALFYACKADVGNPHQKLVLIILADISNEYDQCWPSHDYISRMVGCNRRTVIRALAELEGKGFIRITRRQDDEGMKSSNLYTVQYCPVTSDVTESHNGVSTVTVSESQNGTPDVTQSHRGSDTESHNTPIDTQDIFINQNAWVDWIKYRKERGKSLTPTTAERQIAFLQRYDTETQAAIINESIMHGWTGLFPLKLQAALKPSRRTTLREDLNDTSWAN